MRIIYKIFLSLFAITFVICQQLTINTPSNPVICQPLLLTWNGGVSPYFLSILPGNQPSAPPIHDFGQINSNSLTWIVNIKAGIILGLTLRDSTGSIAQSSPFTVQDGPDNSCLG